MAFSGEYMVPIQDAQKLERELAEATKQRDTLAEALKRWSIIREWLEMDVYIKGYMSNEKDFFDGLDKTLAATKGGQHE
jgi:hypothetical protein